MIKKILFVATFLSLVSCGPKIFVDYDTETDFEKYKAYNFYDPSNSGLNELDNKRVMNAIEAELDSLDKKQKLIPDFSIEFIADKFVKNQPHNVGVSLGGGVAGVGGSVPVNSKKEMIALTINFADALTDELFWQVVVEAEFDTEMKPQERKKFYTDLISQALANYPPQQEGS